MEGLKKSWLIVVEVWEKGLFGIDISRIVVAIIIFFGFLLIRRLFSKIVIGWLKTLTKRTKILLDDALGFGKADRLYTNHFRYFLCHRVPKPIR
jgi:MscS family membrane protein